MMTASSARQIGQSRTSTSPEDRGTRVLRSRRAKRCMRSAFPSLHENSQNCPNLSLLAGCTHTGRGLHTIPGCTAPHERSGSNPSPSKGCDRLCCIGQCRCPGDSGGMLRSQGRPAPAVASSAFTGFRFPTEIIVLAVRWYLRFGLSYRDLEELLTERGIEVDHVTVFRWVQRFTPFLADAARPCRHAVGDRWFVDETYVKVARRWRYVYRAIDQYGQIIDVYVSARRDIRAARRFFVAV